MRQYYVAFLSSPGPKNKHPYEILFPAGAPRRQFDTIQAAKAARDLHRYATNPKYQADIGSWEIVDLWATLQSPMLVTVE